MVLISCSFCVMEEKCVRSDRSRGDKKRSNTAELVERSVYHRASDHTIHHTIHHTSHVHVTYSVVAGRHPNKVSFKESN